MPEKKPKQPTDIRVTITRKSLRLAESAAIDDARWLCALWHNRFGACLVLDNDRFRALVRRLVDQGFTRDQVADAIRAYHEHCTTDRWRLEHPEARLTLASFLFNERFEHWIEEGEKLAAKSRGQQARAVERKAEREQITTMEGLWAHYQSMPLYDQKLLLDRACAEAEARGVLRGGRSAHSPFVKPILLKLLQRDLAAAGRTAGPIGASIDSALEATSDQRPATRKNPR
jgi:hypothetical protein